MTHILDTDHFSLWEAGHPAVTARVRASMSSLGTSVITVFEVLRGRTAVLNRRLSSAQTVDAFTRLRKSLTLCAAMPIAEFDATSDSRFSMLKQIPVRIGSMDLRIAAIALSAGLVVVTRNRVDFGRVPGLVIEDWSN